MNSIKKTVRSTLAALLIVFSHGVKAQAPSDSGQDTKARESAPSNSGPSLGVTLQFIADKMGEIGPVDYLPKVITVDKKHAVTVHSVKIFSKIDGDPHSCALKFHFREFASAYRDLPLQEQEPIEVDDKIALSKIKAFEVRTTWPAEVPAFGGQSLGKDLTTGKPLYLLSLTDATGKPLSQTVGDAIIFNDEALATRVGKAFVHAGDVCGANAPEPF